MLGLFMLSAGIAHLSYLKGEFHAQVPDWLPIDKDLVVVLSGWVEITLGAAILCLPRFKVWIGLALALFFVAIFPGNISQYVNSVDAFGLDTDSKRFARLFFQPVLIIWALWSSGALKELRKK
jgi:uncharacterized membrane protein